MWRNDETRIAHRSGPQITVRSQHVSAAISVLHTHATYVGAIDARACCLTCHPTYRRGHATRDFVTAKQNVFLAVSKGLLNELIGQFKICCICTEPWVRILHDVTKKNACRVASRPVSIVARAVTLAKEIVPAPWTVSAYSGPRSSCYTMGWTHRILIISLLALTPEGTSKGYGWREDTSTSQIERREVESACPHVTWRARRYRRASSSPGASNPYCFVGFLVEGWSTRIVSRTGGTGHVSYLVGVVQSVMLKMSRLGPSPCHLTETRAHYEASHMRYILPIPRQTVYGRLSVPG